MGLCVLQTTFLVFILPYDVNSASRFLQTIKRISNNIKTSKLSW